MNNSSCKQSGSYYSCSICLDTASDPVVTKCGHLFCWGCLREWLAIHPECPLCKGAIRKDETGDIIPIYGSGCPDKKSKHAFTERPTPPPAGSAAPSPSHATEEGRPRGMREEAPQRHRAHGMNWLPGLGGGFFFVLPMGFGGLSNFIVPIIICISIYVFITQVWARGLARDTQWRERANMLIVAVVAVLAFVMFMIDVL
eukprot:Tbor_TRINITY_DN3775_c0_g1::TRINITY_DN3775_c0_g1_i1::g.2346::m.2346/K10666/RNF5; E3 ubiquitin-protein ligase RNF5